jgi:hypothetical protein
MEQIIELLLTLTLEFTEACQAKVPGIVSPLTTFAD